ncbi:MAG TPA: hypothetical protein DDZ80_27595 [Cyanobacteria bacterium UBA8803]|nr:hypothetical protein [Cyanobacteria bacterium UBA9273]HBL62035.1 hypothetical protein [Cyanobacteria bacterium UBA8803]
MPVDCIFKGKQTSFQDEWQGKLIVSGACASAQFANDFLAAGAEALVAPISEIPWSHVQLLSCF